ncbi:MAG: GNAT family N-acetyltransferase [Pseudazoarcus pumilus]|nr:GNAT family N-acetyltransferase [Pseudazoarcus pumilus]
MGEVRLSLCDWAQAETRVMPLRIEVFVQEQGVPPEMELDEFDPLSLHAVCEVDGAVIGTGRLLPDGHIGRLAVARDWRARGLGGQMLEALVAEAAGRGLHEAVLHAQVQAEAFYARHGFVAEGAVFDEAGIAHRLMRRALLAG